MARENRVTPTGVIERSPARGLFLGNRGILHEGNGELGRTRWRHQAWVCCRLRFKDWRAPINAPGHYTQLFFLDEAVALAAGHRPCALCRRSDFERYREASNRGRGLDPGVALPAPALDAALHHARIGPDREQRRFVAPLGALPEGVFLLQADREGPLLLWGGRLHRWTHEGYRDGLTLDPRRQVAVLTPAPSVGALRGGYRPAVHPSLANVEAGS